MKGIVFTEFFEMVEERFGFEMSIQLVEDTELKSGGVYTAVGTYSHHEIVALVVKLSEKTEIEIPKLLNVFGHHLFGVFVKAYHHFFVGVDNCFDFFKNIDNYIHVEVLKLYPDAELPKFIIEEEAENKLVLVYSSARKMSDLAVGLMEGAANYFNETIDIKKEMISENGENVRFILTK